MIISFKMFENTPPLLNQDMIEEFNSNLGDLIYDYNDVYTFPSVTFYPGKEIKLWISDVELKLLLKMKLCTTKYKPWGFNYGCEDVDVPKIISFLKPIRFAAKYNL